jgi:hypothetical protein
LQFQPVASYGSGGDSPFSVAVADVNGDGKLDLLVANECATTCQNGAVGVLLGNGDGTFQPAASFYSGGLSPRGIAVADLNGDGHPDLVVANFFAAGGGEGIIGVLLGNGDGTFQPAVTYDSGGVIAASVAIADVNGDGKPDLVVANECATQKCKHGVVAVLLGNGDGTFKKAVKFPAGITQSVVVADVNGDGKPDAIVADFCATSKCASGAVDVLLGNGDGTFQQAVPYNSGGVYTNMVAVADLRGNGKLDLVAGNACSTGIDCSGPTEGVVGVLLGNGDGTFQKAVTYDPGGLEAYSVAVADVNGDGVPDIVVGNYYNLGVLLGNGDGTFQPAVTLDVYYVAASVALADLTGNGMTDIIVSNEAGSNVGVLINGTASRTATATSLGSSLDPSAIGLPVTFTGQVTTQGTGTPTGTVAFYDGATKIATSTLNSNGVATFTTSTLAAGTHYVTAVYSGDSNFAPSSSSTGTQIVQGGGGVVFSPSILDFGTQVDGSVTGPYTAYMTNTGTKAIKIASIQIVPLVGPSGGYSQTNNCGTKLKAGASCAFNVTFTVTEIGEQESAVSVTDNGPKSPQILYLDGDGVFQDGGRLD